MKAMEIYYHDLNKEAQKEFDSLFGPPEDHNHDVSPIATHEEEDNLDDEIEALYPDHC